jgi:hypothetical protein
MVAETTVTVVIGSEVSAQVLPNASNTIAVATSTVDVGFWHSIVVWFTSLFS